MESIMLKNYIQQLYFSFAQTLIELAFIVSRDPTYDNIKHLI